MRAEVVTGERGSCSRRRSARSAAIASCATANPSPGARSARFVARHGVLARRPRAGERRADRNGGSISTSCCRCCRRATTRRGPTSSGCLKQRNALLRGGVRDDEARATLDVFDDAVGARRLAELVRGRLRLIERLVPAVTTGYDDLAGDEPALSPRATTGSGRRRVTAADVDESRDCCARRWRRGGGPRSTAGSRSSVRIATSGACAINGLDARTQASQGEQRTLALALRLAGHEVVRRAHGGAGAACSTTCSASSTAIVRRRWCSNLPPGQTLLTTAGEIPPGRRGRATHCAFTGWSKGSHGHGCR